MFAGSYPEDGQKNTQDLIMPSHETRWMFCGSQLAAQIELLKNKTA